MFGNGTTLLLGTTNTASSLLNVTFGGYDADDLDVSSHDSTDHFRTWVKGMTDAGEIGVEALGDSATINSIAAMAATRAQESATVQFPTEPSASKFECNVYVKGLEIGAPHDDLISVSFTMKIANKPTFSLV